MKKILALNSLGFDEVNNIGNAVQGIRRLYAGGVITLITTPQAKEIATNAFAIDEYITYSVGGKPFLKPINKVLSLAALVKRVHRTGFDTVAIVRSSQTLRLNPRLEVIAFLSGARNVIEIGFEGALLKERPNNSIGSSLKLVSRYFVMVAKSKGLFLMLRAAAIIIYGYFKVSDRLRQGFGGITTPRGKEA